jgi:hypothetical protein
MAVSRPLICTESAAGVARRGKHVLDRDGVAGGAEEALAGLREADKLRGMELTGDHIRASDLPYALVY